MSAHLNEMLDALINGKVGEAKVCFHNHLREVLPEILNREDEEQTLEERTYKRVKSELVEQWVAEKAELVDLVKTVVSEFLGQELKELKTDISNFRDLEKEYAEKLLEAKAEMANELKSDLKELVEKIDVFLEIRIAAEIDELKEDLLRAKNELGVQRRRNKRDTKGK